MMKRLIERIENSTFAKWIRAEFSKNEGQFIFRMLIITLLAILAIDVVASIFLKGVSLGSFSTSGLLRNIILLLASFGALYGLVLGARRQKHNDRQQKHNNRTFELDQLSRGSDLLSGESSSSKIAGINILEKLHNINKDEQIPEVLQTFISEQAVLKFRIVATGYGGENEKEDKTANYSRKRRLHIQKALFALSKTIKDTSKINLSDLCLFALTFNKINLKGANLVKADLRVTDLVRAKLGGKANLLATKFEFSDVSDADFKGAEHLTQEQVKDMIYKKDNPPKNLPDGMQPKPENAYDENNNFIQNNHWTKKYETNNINEIRQKIIKQNQGD